MSDEAAGYVLAHGGDHAERRRLELLERFHGPLTISELGAIPIGPGWRCLEAGAGAGLTTQWLAERIIPGGRVLAIDIETQWLAPLQNETIEVRRGDITAIALPLKSFDLVLARMLLLHLPDPAQTCEQLVATAAPGGSVVIQDADFTAVALQDATDAEAEGIDVMTKTMSVAGVHIALAPQLGDLLQAAGAELQDVRQSHRPATAVRPRRSSQPLRWTASESAPYSPARATLRLMRRSPHSTTRNDGSPDRPSGSSAPPPCSHVRRRYRTQKLASSRLKHSSPRRLTPSSSSTTSRGSGRPSSSATASLIGICGVAVGTLASA